MTSPPDASAQPAFRLQLDLLDLNNVVPPSQSSDAPAELSQPGPGHWLFTLNAENGVQGAVSSDVQRELETVRAENSRLNGMVEQLNAQLAQVNDQKRHNPLVYALMVLVLVLLIGVAYVRKAIPGRGGRLGATKPVESTAAEVGSEPAPAKKKWWETSITPKKSSTEAQAVAAVPAAGILRSVYPSGVKKKAEKILRNKPARASILSAKTPAEEVSVQLDSPDAIGDAGFVTMGAPADEGLSTSHDSTITQRPTPTALDVGALEDLWQKVRFFESIGQYREAMSALAAFVAANPGATEAPYLLWLQLASVHGDESDRGNARSSYEAHFARAIPAPALHPDQDELADDAVFMQALLPLWPTPAAIDLLTQALSSQPAGATSPLSLRSLSAFDDLLMLKGVIDLHPTCSGDPVQDDGAELLGWKSVTQLEQRPAQVATPAAVDNSIDFDLGSLETGRPSSGKPSIE